jgi:hypothetical protein
MILSKVCQSTMDKKMVSECEIIESKNLNPHLEKIRNQVNVSSKIYSSLCDKINYEVGVQGEEVLYSSEDSDEFLKCVQVLSSTFVNFDVNNLTIFILQEFLVSSRLCVESFLKLTEKGNYG